MELFFIKWMFLSLTAYSSVVEKAKLDVCLPDVCLSVEADHALESSVDRSLVFHSSRVSYFHPDSKKLIKKVSGNEVTWRPHIGHLVIKSKKGEVENFDFKSSH